MTDGAVLIRAVGEVSKGVTVAGQGRAAIVACSPIRYPIGRIIIPDIPHKFDAFLSQRRGNNHISSVGRIPVRSREQTHHRQNPHDQEKRREEYFDNREGFQSLARVILIHLDIRTGTI